MEKLIWISNFVEQKNKLVVNDNITVLPSIFSSFDQIPLDASKTYQLALVYHQTLGHGIPFKSLSDISHNITPEEEKKYKYFSKDLIALIKKFNIKVIDLLTCDMPHIPEIEGITVRYSLDKTGNVKDGTNWVLESHNVNVKDEYFSNTDEFTEVLTSGFQSSESDPWNNDPGTSPHYNNAAGKVIVSYLTEDFTTSGGIELVANNNDFIIIEGNGHTLTYKTEVWSRGLFNPLFSGQVIIRNLNIVVDGVKITDMQLKDGLPYYFRSIINDQVGGFIFSQSTSYSSVSNPSYSWNNKYRNYLRFTLSNQLKLLIFENTKIDIKGNCRWYPGTWWNHEETPQSRSGLGQCAGWSFMSGYGPLCHNCIIKNSVIKIGNVKVARGYPQNEGNTIYDSDQNSFTTDYNSASGVYNPSMYGYARNYSMNSLRSDYGNGYHALNRNWTDGDQEILNTEYAKPSILGTSYPHGREYGTTNSGTSGQGTQFINPYGCWTRTSIEGGAFYGLDYYNKTGTYAGAATTQHPKFYIKDSILSYETYDLNGYYKNELNGNGRWSRAYLLAYDVRQLDNCLILIGDTKYNGTTRNTDITLENMPQQSGISLSKTFTRGLYRNVDNVVSGYSQYSDSPGNTDLQNVFGALGGSEELSLKDTYIFAYNYTRMNTGSGFLKNLFPKSSAAERRGYNPRIGIGGIEYDNGVTFKKYLNAFFQRFYENQYNSQSEFRKTKSRITIANELKPTATETENPIRDNSLNLINSLDINPKNQVVPNINERWAVPELFIKEVIVPQDKRNDDANYKGFTLSNTHLEESSKGFYERAVESADTIGNYYKHHMIVNYREVSLDTQDNTVPDNGKDFTFNYRQSISAIYSGTGSDHWGSYAATKGKGSYFDNNGGGDRYGGFETRLKLWRNYWPMPRHYDKLNLFLNFIYDSTEYIRNKIPQDILPTTIISNRDYTFIPKGILTDLSDGSGVIRLKTNDLLSIDKGSNIDEVNKYYVKFNRSVDSDGIYTFPSSFDFLKSNLQQKTYDSSGIINAHTGTVNSYLEKIYELTQKFTDLLSGNDSTTGSWLEIRKKFKDLCSQDGRNSRSLKQIDPSLNNDNRFGSSLHTDISGYINTIEFNDFKLVVDKFTGSTNTFDRSAFDTDPKLYYIKEIIILLYLMIDHTDFSQLLTLDTQSNITSWST